MPGGRLVSSPLLPIAEAGSEDVRSHQMLRVVQEEIALSRINVSEDARLRVLAQLDRLPVGMRSSIGRYLLDSLAEMSKLPPGENQWLLRKVVGGRGTEHLAFGVSSSISEVVQGLFRNWVCLRHQQARDRLGDPDLTTVGVLLTPRRGAPPWDTTMVAATGDVGFTSVERKQLEKVWPLDEGELPLA